MQRIKNKRKYTSIWNKLDHEYQFDPDYYPSERKWLNIPASHSHYRLPQYLWSEEQEQIVHDIFSSTVTTDMYALNWQHDCFIFNPKEKLEFDERGIILYSCKRRNGGDTYVYFPTFYPNGDYHFFISTDWQQGIFAHPWRKELYVMGENLIEQFEQHAEQLDIKRTILITASWPGRLWYRHLSRNALFFGSDDRYASACRSRLFASASMRSRL